MIQVAPILHISTNMYLYGHVATLPAEKRLFQSVVLTVPPSIFHSASFKGLMLSFSAKGSELKFRMFASGILPNCQVELTKKFKIAETQALQMKA